MQQFVTISASINLTKRFDKNLYFILVFEILNIAFMLRTFSYLYRMTNSIIVGQKSDGEKKELNSHLNGTQQTNKYYREWNGARSFIIKIEHH